MDKLYQLTLFVFHFEIYVNGKDSNNELLLNKYFILIRLFVFYFVISGNDDNNELSENS